MKTPYILTDKLSYRYNAGSPPVVDKLSLRVPAKSIYGFLGHNGAGKTTTIRLLLGLLNTSDKIMLLGENLSSNSPVIFSRIGTLIEQPSLYGNLTAAENLRVICHYRGLSPGSIPGILDTVNLGAQADKKTKTFSTGMKQRLGLAIALLGDPELIILDEPSNGLDPQGMLEIRELIKRLNKEQGKTIFLSSHLLGEVEKMCTHVGIIKQGVMLFQGAVDQLKALNKGTSVSVLFETGNNEAVVKLLGQHGFECRLANGHLMAQLAARQEVSALIDLIRENKIDIYQVRVESKNLEELFFHLHNEQTGGHENKNLF